jgi:hypothetical protein
MWSAPTLPVDFVGASRSFWIEAFDTRGLPVDADGVRVTSDNDAVARVSHVQVVSGRDASGRIYRWAWATVLETGVGTTTITATAGGLSASESLQVRPVPSARVELVVDSFTIAEYAPGCARACPYVSYAPLLWLSEPAGTSGEALEAVHVSLGTLSTGWCRSSGTPLAPGQEIRINERIDPYLYNNDLILVNPAGPVADPTGTARLLVRNAAGEFGIVEVSTQVRRNSSEITFGPPPARPCG